MPDPTQTYVASGPRVYIADDADNARGADGFPVNASLVTTVNPRLQNPNAIAQLVACALNQIVKENADVSL